MSVVIPTNEPIQPNLRKLAVNIKRRQLPRDYARCHGLGEGNILCDRRESCLRYVDISACTENLERAVWILPDLKLGGSGCEEYIGD